MAAIATRVLWNHRSLYGRPEFKFPEQSNPFVSDIEFEFLEDYNVFRGYNNGCGDDNHDDDHNDHDHDDGGDDEKENYESSYENNKSFWENQHQVLQQTLCRTNSIEAKIRNATKEALRDIQGEASAVCCGCGKSTIENCRNCLMREVSSRLQNNGFGSAVCRSKWRSSPDIPAGEHSFMDVIENSRKGEVRVIIELNLRAEFEIARASEDYNRLVQRLPEVFVGKIERLNNVIKILCLAAKKCMKEKKMHMGPWRKQRYMQAKWLKSCERNTSTQSLPVGHSGSRLLTKPRASMLTVDLMETLSNVHCTVLEVV